MIKVKSWRKFLSPNYCRRWRESAAKKLRQIIIIITRPSHRLAFGQKCLETGEATKSLEYGRGRALNTESVYIETGETTKSPVME